MLQMTEIVQEDINKIHERLRSIDEELGHLGSTNRMSAKRRFNGPDFGGAPGGFKARERTTFDGTSSFGPKRRRLSDATKDEPLDDDDARLPKRSVQSTVVMPAIETKSREEKLEEIAKTEKKEVVNRNRRMFSNLLMGTLTQFKKNERGAAQQKQAEKLEQIEKKLEDTKRQDKEKVIQERQTLMNQRREKERELKQLTRKKALMQYAEVKQGHYRLLSNFIQTRTEPVMFFLPAKHTVRSLELLKNSQKMIDGLINRRQKELERELEQPTHEHSDGENDNVKSIVAKPKGKELPKSLRRKDHRRSPSVSDDDEKADNEKADDEMAEDEKAEDEKAADEEENFPEVQEKGDEE